MSAKPHLVVVGGERYWHDFLPEWAVIYCRLQVSQWIIQDGTLKIRTESGLVEVHAVLWRVGVIAPEPWHRAVLDLIRISGVLCINSAASLQRGFDKLSMYAEMKAAGLPVIPAQVSAGNQALSWVSPELPCVLKVGNHHGGLGKARALTQDQWSDLVDLAAIVPDYALGEPFISYVADVRCLVVGQQVWCMRRESEDWKVNRGTAQPVLMDTPAQLEIWSRHAADHLGSFILGLDFIQKADGEWLLLECNDVPGIAGFPDVVKHDVASAFRAFS